MRLVDILEPALGVLVAGVTVRVVLTRQPAKRLLDLRLAGGSRDAQDLVIVAEFHGRPALPLMRPRSEA